MHLPVAPRQRVSKEASLTPGSSTGRFRNHSELTGVTCNLYLDFLRCCIRRAKESRPRERHGETGTKGRTLVEHLDPGEQMAHRLDIDICPMSASAVRETGDIHECATLTEHKRAAR